MQPKFISPATPLLPHLLQNQSNTNFRVIPQKPGELFTFGSAVGGELGLGPHTHERKKPGSLKWLNDIPPSDSSSITSGGGLVAVECGGQHTLALDSSGRVWSWGVNDQGALGRETIDADVNSSSDEDSDNDDDDQPASVNHKHSWRPGVVPLAPLLAPGDRVIQMVCADSFSAVLTTQGAVYAWGSFRDPSGVIGFSKTMRNQSQHLPSRLKIPKKVVLLGSGDNHVFMICEDDTLWAMGANDENQLGRRVCSRFKNNLEPYEITGRRQSNLRNIIKITGGAYHTLYVNAQGELYSFGCNNCGQLGLGDTESHLNGPERVSSYIDNTTNQVLPLPPIIDIAAGESHSLVLSRDGRIFAFGANLENQLGFKIHTDDYHYQFQSMPRLLNPSTNWSEDSTHGLPPSNVDPVVMVDAQSRFSICVTSLGKLYTWGSGHSYQLGNEEMEDEEQPFRVVLKGRKCFWARCGGQFSMFLLEPKDTGTEYRQPPPIAPSSLPGSPERNMETSSPPRPTTTATNVPPIQTDHRSTSPTSQLLQASFESVCVSPEKKRPRVMDGGSEMSVEERMAPWSPTKSRGGSMESVSSGGATAGSSRRSVKDRFKDLQQQEKRVRRGQ